MRLTEWWGRAATGGPPRRPGAGWAGGCPPPASPGVPGCARSGTGPAQIEGLGLVAVGASDVASGQPDEHLPLAHQGRLALDGREDLGGQDVGRRARWPSPQCGIVDAGVGEPARPQDAGVADPAGRVTALVARPRHAQGRVELQTQCGRSPPWSIRSAGSGWRWARPSTPRFWPVAATPRKASMNSGRQSGYPE